MREVVTDYCLSLTESLTFWNQTVPFTLLLIFVDPRSTWRTSSREKKPSSGTSRKRWRRFRCSAKRPRKDSQTWTCRWSICFRRSKERGNDSPVVPHCGQLPGKVDLARICVLHQEEKYWGQWRFCFSHTEKTYFSMIVTERVLSKEWAETISCFYF